MGARRSEDSVRRFVVCIDNTDYEASLELRKLYSVVPDPDAARNCDLRIVDESSEGYLYFAEQFVTINRRRVE